MKEYMNQRATIALACKLNGIVVMLEDSMQLTFWTIGDSIVYVVSLKKTTM